jgi:hypothetical protein
MTCTLAAFEKCASCIAARPTVCSIDDDDDDACVARRRDDSALSDAPIDRRRFEV